MKDTITGFIFILFGIFFGIYSFEYSLGSSSSMGPAFFPLIVSITLFLLGLLLIIKRFLNR